MTNYLFNKYTILRNYSFCLQTFAIFFKECFLIILFFETEFHSLPKLSLNSWQICISLSSATTKGTNHHAQHFQCFKKETFVHINSPQKKCNITKVQLWKRCIYKTSWSLIESLIGKTLLTLTVGERDDQDPSSHLHSS